MEIKMLAIGFDLDNTLYNRNDHIKKMIVQLNEKENLDISTRDFIEVFNSRSEVEYQKFIHGDKTRDAYRLDRTLQTFEALNIDLSYDEMKAFNADYDARQSNLSLRPYAEEFMQKLIAEGHKLFIITNGSSRDQRNKLAHLKLESYIPKEYWYISGELDMTKPNKEIFQYVEEQITSKKYLYIGDNHLNDIVPTQELGWTSIYINDDVENERIHSEYFKVDSFKEIYNFYLETNKFRS